MAGRKASAGARRPAGARGGGEAGSRAETSARSGRPEADDLSGDEGRVVHVAAPDGTRLAARIFDPVDGPGGMRRLPLFCLPGLSRNSRDFSALARFASRHPAAPRRVVALDFRGRGLSEPSPDWRDYAPQVEAEDAVAAAVALGIDRAVLVGTSRGGIVTMILGSLRPNLLAGVVLNDIGPVLESGGLARIKGYLPSRRPLARWDDAIAAVRQAGIERFPALTAADWSAHARAYYAPTSRGLEPQFDERLLKILDAIQLGDRIPTMWPQYESLARVPLLAVRGQNSDLLSMTTLAEMAARHPRFDQLTVPGQGHAPLLRDALSMTRIADFAAKCEAG